MTSRKTPSICVVGSANLDLTVRTETLPRPGETVAGGPLRLLPGGKSANQAAAAALLGGDVTLVAAIGEDAHGDLVLESLAASGVDTSAVRRVAGTATGTAMIAVDGSGENVIIVSDGANGCLTAEDVAAHADRVRAASVLGLSFEVPMAATAAAARTAHEHGVTVVLNPSPFAAPPAELLADVDVLVVNEHEFAQLVGPTGTPWSPTLLDGLTVPHVVVTRGEEGAVVLSNARNGAPDDGVLEVPAVPVEAVDTTGAGDAFTGALLHGLASGEGLEQSVVRACAVGAYAATGVGAQASYPTVGQLEDFLRVSVAV